MFLISRTALLESYLPLFQAKRLRSKINIQKPKPPHHVKATFLAVAKPYYISPNKSKQPFELCEKDRKIFKKDVENPFQKIIAGEVLRRFQNSRLIAFYHMNSMKADDQGKAYTLFKKQNMHCQNFGKETLKLALQGTPYEAVLNLFISRNMLVFSPEPEIKKMLKVSKKFRQLVLMAAIYEGKFVNKDELMEYSLIPDLRTAQAGLVQTLNTMGSQVVGQLTTHQNILVNQLQDRIKQLEEK